MTLSLLYLCVWSQGTCTVQGTAGMSQFSPSSVWTLGSDSGHCPWQQAPLLTILPALSPSLMRTISLCLETARCGWIPLWSLGKYLFSISELRKKDVLDLVVFFPHECFVFICLSWRAEMMRFSWSPRSCDSEHISSLWLRLLLTQLRFIILFRQWNFWEAVI